MLDKGTFELSKYTFIRLVCNIIDYISAKEQHFILIFVHFSVPLTPK